MFSADAFLLLFTVLCVIVLIKNFTVLHGRVLTTVLSAAAFLLLFTAITCYRLN